VYLTTDGVHGPNHSTEEELRDFALYCIANGIKTNSLFSASLSEFLHANVSDNYSALLTYRPTPIGALAAIAGGSVK
jgi:hypothetical protein